MSYRLRPMRWWDIEAVVALEAELFAADPPWTAEQFWSELAGVPDTRWYVVAEPDDAPEAVAGYAGLLFTGETADLQTIAVAPEHQRHGLGGMLLTAAVDEARSRGAQELLLDVRADNPPALALYAKHGFDRIARRRGYYAGGRVDGLVLRRRLTRGTR